MNHDKQIAACEKAIEFAEQDADLEHAKELRHILAELEAGRLHGQRMERERRAGFRRQDGGW